MLSNSAKSTSLFESRFRIAEPNSIPRQMVVIAIGSDFGDIEILVKTAARPGLRFVTCGSSALGEDWRAVVAAQDVDAVLLLVDLNSDRLHINAIGSYCLERGIKLATLLLVPPGMPHSALESLLADLRFWSHMLSIISNADDIGGIVQALGS